VLEFFYGRNTQMSRYLVFLDIDGVFTSSRVHYSRTDAYDMWAKFDPVAVDFMNKISDRFHNVEFVCMSTWKNFLDTKSQSTVHIFEAMWRNAGFKGKFADPWKTDPDNTLWKSAGMDRGDEVVHYLENYGTDVKDYILFDDNAYNFNKVLPKKRLIQTNPENGLLYRHMTDAMSIMGNWSEK
jgi:hypothetical protein